MISQVKIQTESGYWEYAPPENFVIKGLENLPFSAETNTQENAVVSCLFYPSLVLSVKVDFHCRVIYRAYTRKFYARKMYQSSRFNDKNGLFQEIKSIYFSMFRLYMYARAYVLRWTLLGVLIAVNAGFLVLSANLHG